ncbi:type II toxin-antitoxin system RelB/DinJ family antitoxin [Levilactobacillus brevis]|nr:type II toxin-antitoxin system RelB/DinJ family antitoxin [Levilactobacillus brevis]
MTTQHPQHLSIPVDGALKTEAQAVYQRLGLDLPTAVTLFLKQSVADQGLPFTPDAYSPAVARELVHSDHLKIYNSLAELWHDLDQQ